MCGRDNPGSISPPLSSRGCCADGGRCDDLCIQIAASYECNHASNHTNVDTRPKADTCSGSPRSHRAEPSCRINPNNSDDLTNNCCSPGKSDKVCGNVREEQNAEPAADSRSCCGSVTKKAGSWKTSGENVTKTFKDPMKPVVDTDRPDMFCGSIKGKERDGSCRTAETPKDDASCSGNCCGSSEDYKSKGSQGSQSSAVPEEVSDAACPMACCDSPENSQDDCGEADNNKDSCCKSGDGQVGDENESCCAPDLRCSLSKMSEGSQWREKAPEDGEKSSFRHACASHLRRAFEKYSAYLETGRCICRNALSSQVNICCDKELRSAALVAAASSSADVHPKSSVVVAQQTKHRGCRAQEKFNMPVASGTHSRCSFDDIKPSKPSRKAPASTMNVEADPERSAARETVHFNITGMTCTGCSNKALKTLNLIDGVSRANVVFVTSIGEVDLDPCVTSSEAVLEQLERETGFKCTRVFRHQLVLEIVMASETARKLQECPPDGISSIIKTDRSYQVGFDPAVLGARSVLSITAGELAPPQDHTSLAERKKRLRQMALSTVLATVFTVPILVLAWSNVSTAYSTRSVVSLVLATLVQGLAVSEFYVGAIRALVYSKVVEMDMLVVISITAAYGYSVVAFALTHAGYKLEQGEFFETSSLLITLILFGRLIAAISKAKAISAVSLKSLQAETACLVQTSGGTIDIDARLLQFGDNIMVKPHSRVVTDGVVVKGTSTIDESMLTGENLPVSKGPKDLVTAGTVNGSGLLTVRITRLPGQNSISDIANLVEDAIAAKPRVQDLADRVAGWFIPVVISIATLVFIIWLVIALKVRKENGGGAVGLSITYSIAVLAISCPCALGLAVPMVLVITGGVAARGGVIIKQADATEKSHKVTHVIFDKTGTLTTGVLEVVTTQILAAKFAPKQVHSLLSELLKDNDHPVSKAVESSLQKSQISHVELQMVESIPGCGIQAVWKGATVRAGNPYWLCIEEHPVVAALISQGMTLLCVTIDTELVAVYGLKSVIREEATDVIAKLHRKGITCHIVSGDGPRVVEDTARMVGIPFDYVASCRSPAEKQHYVKVLMDQGNSVLFCGDGTNDAVAIAQATVGVQIGSASDITRATADVVLLGGLECIPILLDISKRSFNRIVFNFVWSAVYNVFAILLAAGAFVKWHIPPAFAGVGEVVSVLPVIISALSLMYIRRF